MASPRTTLVLLSTLLLLALPALAHSPTPRNYQYGSPSFKQKKAKWRSLCKNGDALACKKLPTKPCNDSHDDHYYKKPYSYANQKSRPYYKSPPYTSPPYTPKSPPPPYTSPPYTTQSPPYTPHSPPPKSPPPYTKPPQSPPPKSPPPYTKPPQTPPYKSPPPYTKPPQSPPYTKPPHSPPYKSPPYDTKPPQSPPYKAPSPPPKSPPYEAPSAWAKKWLDPHNKARSQLGIPPLVWDDKVAKYAEWWANERKLNGNCQMAHSNGPYGENLFWGIGYPFEPQDCVDAWVSEKDYYHYNTNSCNPGEKCGHYTQVIWKASTRLGCARIECDSGDIFMTCNYDPPGNWIGYKPY